VPVGTGTTSSAAAANSNPAYVTGKATGGSVSSASGGDGLAIICW
jgi:hypothetical protein